MNIGGDNLSTADFGYKLGTNAAVTQTGVSLGTLTPGSFFNHVFSTVMNIPAAGSYQLKVWARNPNNVYPDLNVNNDTLIANICTGLSGTYTINPTGSGSSNFTSFTNAVNTLKSCGVAGPVTLNVAAGNFNEQIEITGIAGVSAVNTITFNGTDTSNCRIYYGSTSTTDNYVVKINGTGYVKFKNITIENTATLYIYASYFAAWVTNGANYITFDKCKFIAPNGGYYTTCIGISGNNYYTGTAASFDSVLNSRMVGGYYAVCYAGNNGNTSNCIANNRIENYSYFGVSLYPGVGICLSDNKILNPTSTITYGIYIYNETDFTVERNQVEAKYMGIYIGYTTSFTGRHLVANNTVVSHNTPYSTFYGIYGYAYADIVFNSVYSNGNGYCAYFYAGNNYKLENNIFLSNHATCYALYTQPSYHSLVDYNNYFNQTGGYFVYFATAYTDLTTLKAGNAANNKKSVSVLPAYLNTVPANGPFDLHLSSGVPSPTGDPSIVSMVSALDVDRNARCLFAPTIGADESTYTTGSPVAGFTMPDTIYVNSPFTFINNNSINAPLGHQWWVDGVSAGTTLNLPWLFTATGSHTVKLKTSGCSGVDSITKVITVVNPTVAPIADFIADLNIVETYAPVQLTDLSTRGPSNWYWTFAPATGVNFNNSTTSFSQNPNISFSNPGLYTICLKDSNSAGAGATVCKTAYILVRATNSMCIFPFDTKIASGTLYDDGGPNGVYGNNHTTPCTFLIDPCASSVNMKFTQFNLAANDYLRVYNGKDKFGIPLHTGLGFTGTALPGGAAGLTANSGKMFIEFVTDASTNAAGFAATWTSVAGSFAAPTGSLNDPDTVYDCGALFDIGFQPAASNFSATDAYYRWYFDWVNNNSFPDVEGKGVVQTQWSYGSTGTYVIRCEVEGCNGTLILYDTIVVEHPNGGPIVNFSANLLTATTTDIVTFTDLSKIDPTWWKWSFSGPGTVSYAAGNQNSKNPGVRFSAVGTYSVTLMDSNCVGSNSLTKTNYINIINYCIPAVGTLNPDFAIERVRVGRADTLVKNTVPGFDFTNTTPTIGTITYRDNTSQTATYLIGQTSITKNVEAILGLGTSTSFTIDRLSNFNACNFKVWVDFNQDGTFDQTTELVASSGITAGKSYNGSIVVPTTAKVGYTRMRIGTSFNNTSNTPCGANQFGDFNDFRIKITPDETAPIITFNGWNAGAPATVFVEVGRSFNDPGYTVSDDVTNPCPNTRSGIANGTVITTHPSTNSYTVTATDAAGNISTNTLTVKSNPDTTKPVIVMKYISPVYVEVGTSYTDSGATATDFYFGNFTSQIVTTSTVNTSKIGTYTVTYNVKDSSNNNADPVVRTVIVRDTQKPVITVSGANPLYVNVFSSFNIPTATVTDNYNTGLTYTVTGGPVNTNVLGTYTLNYNAIDSSGNAATTVVLTVIVRDVTMPEFTLIPPDTMIIDVKTLTSVPEPGYIYRDDYYPNSQLTITKTGTVDLNVIGTYVIRYRISDPSGNTDSTKFRVYKVVDRFAPVITLKGMTFMNWPRWKPFVDPGYTVTDNYDVTVNVTVDQSKLNIYLDGIYPITYSATDAAGNKATDVIRYVNIYTQVGINSQNTIQCIQRVSESKQLNP